VPETEHHRANEGGHRLEKKDLDDQGQGAVMQQADGECVEMAAPPK